MQNVYYRTFMAVIKKIALNLDPRHTFMALIRGHLASPMRKKKMREEERQTDRQADRGRK